MKKLMLFFGILLLFYACQNSSLAKGEKSVEEIMTDSKISNADIIRNPVSAEGPVDTVNVAKIEFAESEFNFGEVVEGAVVSHTFSFVNTGRMPLVISAARSTCGCTVPEWPREPVPPGAKGTIAVKFNTTGKRGEQDKPVNITANTYPAVTTVNLVGKVKAKDPRFQ